MAYFMKPNYRLPRRGLMRSGSVELVLFGQPALREGHNSNQGQFRKIQELRHILFTEYFREFMLEYINLELCYNNTLNIL